MRAAQAVRREFGRDQLFRFRRLLQLDRPAGENTCLVVRCDGGRRRGSQGALHARRVPRWARRHIRGHRACGPRQRGREGFHRRAGRAQLPSARAHIRPGEDGGRHHRGMQHRELGRKARRHAGAHEGGRRARLHRHRPRGDHGRRRRRGASRGGREAPGRRLRGQGVHGLRLRDRPGALQRPRSGRLRRRHQERVDRHRIGSRQELHPFRRNPADRLRQAPARKSSWSRWRRPRAQWPTTWATTSFT